MFEVAINKDGTTDCFCVEGDLCVSINNKGELTASVSTTYPNEAATELISIEGLIVLRDFLTKVINGDNVSK